MIKTAIFFTSLILTLPCFGQDWSIILRQELLDGLINHKDSIFIENRNQLEKIDGFDCTDKILTCNYVSKSGDKIEIKIEKGLFNPVNHKLDLVDTVYKFIHDQKRVDYSEVKNKIDGRISYGIDGTIPKSEITSMTIMWNEKFLSIPDSAYSNLYQPHICSDYLKVESYLTKGNRFLYIYLSGSDGAGGYSVKFIFDKDRYVTRIVGTNEMTDGFDFLDGTAKVDE